MSNGIGSGTVPSYGSVANLGQLYPVFTASGIFGGNGVGPIYRGAGSPPLQTLPSGVSQTGIANVAAPAPKHLAFILAGMFVVGIVWLKYVHWSA